MTPVGQTMTASRPSGDGILDVKAGGCLRAVIFAIRVILVEPKRFIHGNP